ncbi:MAG: putative ABC transporter permease [Oscillospiraceae bacterium]|nr:putative ABC transporter permease [Oscillospiraceae bacterium]
MIYSDIQLGYFFFIYSFIGWCSETILAYIKNRKYTNKGFVNMPFCILYGFAAVFITVFCKDLTGIWLFIWAGITATLFEWTAGHFIEYMFKERWWDYSGTIYNIDGYICLPVSFLWSVLGYIAVRFTNRYFAILIDIIPATLARIIIIIMTILLVADIVSTYIIYSHSKGSIYRKKLDKWFTENSDLISAKLYTGVNKRIVSSYRLKNKENVDEADKFANGCGFYKLVWVFFISAFLGDIIETLYCRVVAGYWMSRTSLVWGHFSVVWGVACRGITLILYRYRKKPVPVLLVYGTILGSFFEYMCSVFTEIFFGQIFWDYSDMKYNLGGRINLLYSVFWGIAAVVWLKLIYPFISDFIEKVIASPGKIISWVMILFMCANMLVSSMALIRNGQRNDGVPAVHTWQITMDKYYDNRTVKEIYPNAQYIYNL